MKILFVVRKNIADKLKLLTSKFLHTKSIDNAL